MAKQSGPSTGRSKKLGLTPKLVALIVSTTGAIVLFLGIYFPEQQIRASRDALQKKAATYGRLVAHQVTSAIAFDDRATAREVFDSLAKDEDVASLTLLRANGEPLHAHGKAGSWIAAAKRGVRELRVLDLGTHVAAVAPVVSLEGPRGTLVIELSTRALEADKARITRMALFAGAAALALGSILALLIARSLGKRVGAIADVASKVAAGDLDQKPTHVGGSDEIAVMGDAFNAMLTQIQTLVAQIKESAQEEQARLEGLVAARTRELDRRNEDMRLVLDNVGQGFLSVKLDGSMSDERSAIVREWFGGASSASFFDYMEQRFLGKGASFRLAFDNLREDWMPIELGIDQLPKQLESGGRHFGFSYRPIRDGERLDKLLVVVSDVTAIVESQRAEEEERELVQVMRWMMSDRTGFLSFLGEADELVHAIFANESNRTERLREVHTLKGNAAIFGFHSIARLCHALEDQMVECGEDLTLEERQRVRTAWSRLRDKMRPFVEGRKSDALDVPRKEYQRIVREVSAHTRHSTIGSLLTAWELEPIEDRFLRVADYAHGLAERLGKGPLDVRVEANEVRLDGDEWSRFWQAIVHVVRNAVDHGLESQDERSALGKGEQGVLILRSTLAEGRLAIEVEDQGRGIDWARVAEVARERGLPASTRHDLELALFSDQLSTRTNASETSGRGVGLSAVRQICLETDGEIAITSVSGQGTTFRFTWDVDAHGHRVAKHARAANG